MSKNPLQFLYIGFAIPKQEMEKYFKKDPFPSIQSNKFNWNIIKSLEYETEFDMHYICTTQVSNYPLFSQKYFNKKEWNTQLFNKNIKILEIPYINTEIFKLVTRFFSSFFYGSKELLGMKNKKGVIVCDIHIPFMLSGYIFSKLFNIEYISIWTDPPAVITERESKLKTKLRLFELKIASYLMKKSDKAIVMTKYLAKDFAPQKPYLLIEGIIDEDEIIEEKVEKSNKEVTIIYTGSLEKRYGIKNIIDGFRLLENKNIILEIYGRGDYEEEVKNICLIDSRIKYYGFIDNKEALKIQKKADFLINARSKEENYTKYTFPSKILEYMMSGTPVITTILSGFPDEYIEHLICLENNLPETIAKKILEVLSWKTSKRRKIGENARKFILSKSYKEQGKKIKEFIES